MTLEDMIREMMKNGATAEDVARKTQDTLNSIEKAEKEKREKEKAIEEDRKVHLQVLEKGLKEDIEKGRHVLNDVGILAALAVIHNYPNWTVDDINAFIENVNKNVKAQAELTTLNEDCLKKIFSIADKMYKPGTCGKCKQKKKEEYNYNSPGEVFLDCVLDMLNRWSM